MVLPLNRRGITPWGSLLGTTGGWGFWHVAFVYSSRLQQAAPVGRSPFAAVPSDPFPSGGRGLGGVPSPPPLFLKDWAKFSSGLSADQNFSSALLAPLQTQHHRGGAGPPPPPGPPPFKGALIIPLPKQDHQWSKSHL